MDQAPRVVHYFVDEAGDLTLFNRRGAYIVGQPGVSHCFMLGVATVEDVDAMQSQLNTLRAKLLADPYFSGVPSMQAEAKRTVTHFHAKDDLPEVRWAVFQLLPKCLPKVHVAIRRKEAIAAEARQLAQRGERLHPNRVYDELVTRLFRNLLHKADDIRITFARRGKTHRQDALLGAIERAKKNFQKKWKIESEAKITITSATPSECHGLQLIDYFLWAAQRLYERREQRYFTSVAPHYRIIMDLDDKRHKRYGEWYSDSNPLTLEKLKPVAD